MSRILTAAQVEAAALEGRRELIVPNGAVVTPLAKDRAVALGVALMGEVTTSLSAPDGAGAPTPGGEGLRLSRRRRGSAPDLDRLVLESKVRILARRALLRGGHGLGEVEDLVTAVMMRLYAGDRPEPACGCPAGGHSP